MEVTSTEKKRMGTLRYIGFLYPALMSNWHSRRLTEGGGGGLPAERSWGDSTVGSIPRYANLSTVGDEEQEPGPKIILRRFKARTMCAF